MESTTKRFVPSEMHSFDSSEQIRKITEDIRQLTSSLQMKGQMWTHVQPVHQKHINTINAQERRETENCGGPIPCPEKQTDYDQTIHNLRGCVSIVNNAIALLAFVGDEKEQMAMLDVIHRNLNTLEMTVERLIRTNELSMVPHELRNSLAETCNKVNGLFEP